MRNVQHKKEAYWFYRFLSLFYDRLVNPFFWTERMRREALELADLNDPDLRTIDVGSGTGFTTEGIVRHIRPTRIDCIDQSPHQMGFARRKPALHDCKFRIGDAEDLPYPTDHFDRYISAGSIEYWPEPRRGIGEAYRVLKPGGLALMIGPLRPQHPVARTLADTWMLFPEEEQYRTWFKQAGFTDLRSRYVRPSWVRREPYGIALVGRKPEPGPSPLSEALGPIKAETVHAPMTLPRAFSLAQRLTVGTLAGSTFIPMALLGRLNTAIQREVGGEANIPPPDPLTREQRVALTVLGAAGTLWLARWLRRR